MLKCEQKQAVNLIIMKMFTKFSYSPGYYFFTDTVNVEQ